MNPRRSTPARLAVSVGAVAVTATLLTGCRLTGNPPTAAGERQVGTDVVRDVAYGPATGCAGPGSDESCGGSTTMDVYRPVAGGNRGTVVFIHGGGFAGGDKLYEAERLGPIMAQTQRGYAVVSVNYRLSRTAQTVFPAPVQDVGAALRWLKANGGSVGVNASKIVLAGHSAGGTLAALAALGPNSGRAEFANIPRVNGWISVSGILERNSGNMSRFWIVNLTGTANVNSWPLANPASWIDPSDPAGYLAQGDQDTVVEMSNMSRFVDVAAARRADGQLTVDVVDRTADGRQLPTEYRGHYPFGGLNAAELAAWIDAR